MGRLLTPRWLLSHLFVLAMVVLMVNLGFWQLRRLDEKKADNDAVTAAIEQAPVDLALVDDLSSIIDYRAASAVGVYLSDQELLVANRTFEGAAGSWIVTPLEMSDGRVVAVVRGWAPRLVIAGEDDRPTESPPGEVTVQGLAFESVSGGRVAILDEGEIPQLSRMDLERYEDVTGLVVIDRWLRLETQSPPQPGDLPVPVPRPPLDDGPHLSYAFQWFFFSVGTVVVYGVILRRTAQDRGVSATGAVQPNSRPSPPSRRSPSRRSPES